MANKKTVVQMYEELLAIPTLTAEQKTFIEKRIEITKNKNAKREGAEPTPKQKEKMTADNAIKANVLAELANIGKPVTVTDLLKQGATIGGYSNQKITALLSQLLEVNAVVRTAEKGKTYYSLPVAEG